ncbi:MAG: hypothetical protein PHW32_00675 [Bacilli bacterium]|nr:hypothetical protein [Bacilli bacterium]MDD4283024.1 hypothetical protein [Bacilli bacterium]MDD4718559.1 hypothetical protein [Bacilli bacterium]
MKRINNTLEKYDLKPQRYQFIGKAIVIDTDDGKYVLKPKNRNINSDIFHYLDSRSFNYYPNILSSWDDDYEITEYLEEVRMPDDQKMLDMVNLVSLLHNKTTYYKEVDESDNKEIYEDITNNIEYLYGYYNDLATYIETKVYMSPSEYTLIRNISKIYSALMFCKKEIEDWYKLIKEKRKQRFVVLHNHLEIDHFIKNRSSYLISWDKAKEGIPIYDIYKLYKRHCLDYEFSEILKHYEKSYPLLEEERKLLFILISLPDIIELNGREYDVCREVSKKIDCIYKTDKLVLPYYSSKIKN